MPDTPEPTDRDLAAELRSCARWFTHEGAPKNAEMLLTAAQRLERGSEGLRVDAVQFAIDWISGLSHVRPTSIGDCNAAIKTLRAALSAPPRDGEKL